MDAAVTALAPLTGVAVACAALGVARSGYYRRQRPGAPDGAPTPVPAAGGPSRRPPSRRALTPAERERIRGVLNGERFADCAPRQVYATLLDAGVYLCSWSTMYAILRAHGEATRRRDRPRRAAYAKPELLATAPRQLWSWDITKLKGPATWTSFYLYVILDVYSRYVVGWMIAERERAELAEALIAETCLKEGIAPDQLTIHADRGSAMTSREVAQLLADLGVTRTHSRPHTSDDNPYSEAQFKTTTYHPTFPDRFGSLEDARAWARPFFDWYNHRHHHTGLGLLTPAVVHHGQAAAVIATRQTALDAAYAAHPERFVRGQPRPPTLPPAVWINPPAPAGPSVAPTPDAGEPSRGEAAQRSLDGSPGAGQPAPPAPAVA